jgi:predicted nucleic acid-binding protein
MIVLADTNVLLDVFDPAEEFHEWSAGQITSLVLRDQLAINPVIYAELAVAFEQTADLDRRLPPGHFLRLELSYEASFLAGQAFRKFLKRSGKRTRPLPDFFIGAHAETIGAAILTRDTARFRTCFPKVRLISP